MELSISASLTDDELTRLLQTLRSLGFGPVTVNTQVQSSMTVAPRLMRVCHVLRGLGPDVTRNALVDGLVSGEGLEATTANVYVSQALTAGLVARSPAGILELTAQGKRVIDGIDEA